MVSVVTATMKPECIDNVFENYTNQKLQEKELIVILNRDDMDLNEWLQKANRYENVSVYQLPGKSTLGDCFNFAIEKAKYDYIAKFDDDDYYAPHYLEEAIATFEETNADIVGKAQYYAYVEKYQSVVLRADGPEHEFVKQLRGPTIVFKKRVFEEVQWPAINKGAHKLFLKFCINKGFKMYSSSKNNFVYIRRSSGNHTWEIKEEEFLKKCEFICYTDDYKKILKMEVNDNDGEG